MISIIIPTLQEGDYLESTLLNLRSALKKPDYEIIISDGGSKDATLTIADKYADQTIIWDKAQRQNISQGRNIGARAAKGELLVFIDADVFIPAPDKFFAIAKKYFTDHPKVVAITVSLVVHENQATLLDKIIFSLANIIFVLLNNILKTGGASGEFQMIRKSAFEKVGGFNENLTVSEDNEMFYRLAKIGSTRIVRKLTVYHSGRRAHKIGWPRLLLSWWTNLFSIMTRKKSVAKEWNIIR